MVQSAFDETVRLGRPLNLEFRVVRPDGAVRWLRDQGDVFETAGQARLAGACVEITDLKEAEDALRRANEELEARVAERTAELAAANATLREAMAARTELLRRLSTAQEDERRRLSRELHDGLGQELTALILSLKALEHAVPQGAAGRDRLLEVERIVNVIGREAHDLAVELRPTALDDLGLGPALSAYVARWSERTGVAAAFQPLGLDGDRLPPEVETAVYRVVQEALNNVAKHAEARRVGVMVSRQGDELTALVEDDGRGFDPEQAGAGPGRRSLGLLGMRERVGLVGGSLVIESGEGEGTVVQARIPLPRAPGEGPHGG
jgi:signal transduction histidine kinase